MEQIIENNKAFLSPIHEIGGKAKNLAVISKFNVPNWFVLSTNFFEEFLKGGSQFENFYQLLSEDIASIDASKLSQKLQEIIEVTTFSNAQRGLVKSKVSSEKLYSVRSSAVDEDGKENSFAGILESYLFQKGEEQIFDSIKACFKSCFSARAIQYRLDKKITIKNISIAVIIQEMISSEKSGVLFTTNPTNGLRHEFVISATYGLGEGVVSGECETDEYIFDIETENLNSTIREKDFGIFLGNEGTGTTRVEIDSSLKSQSTLSEAEIKKLTKLATEITRLKKFPQDIEWAIYQGEVYLLQTRDITSLIPPTKSKSQNIVFDNSNIQESYCGVTTPLTFSYANEAYFRVYHQMLSIMGLKESVIKMHEKRHWNMISFIKGRVYYNINSWYEGLLLFPSFNANKDSMEKMMGLQDPVDFISDKNLSFQEKLELLPTVIRCYWTLIKYFSKIDSVVEDFCTHFEKEYKSFDRENFTFKDMGQLFDYTDQIINNITSRWHAPIVNDFYVMTYHGKALRYLEKLKIDKPEINLSNLLSGEEGIQSTEPTKTLLRISDKIQEHPKLVEFFLNESPIKCAEEVANNWPKIQAHCDEYIDQYGDRVIGELKLESISLREDSSFMFLCLKNYLSQGMSYNSYIKNEQILRKQTEEKVFKEIKSKHGILKLKTFKSLLEKTRKGVKYRENMRLIRTRVFGLSRDIYLEMGRQLQSYGKLSNYRDIMYLTLDELERFRMGRSVQVDLRPLVASRKAEYQTYENDEPAYHFHTTGPVYLGNKFNYPYQRDHSNSDLKGLGCFPGIVEEEIVLMHSPDEVVDIQGKIICTVRTDPGWAPVFPMIKGLIVERGSMLSHSAVIARELGIPTIVGVPEITKKLQTGSKVKMDGELGTIDLL